MATLGSDMEISIGIGYDELQVTRTLNSLANKANSALAQGINANVFSQPLGKITGKANEFQKSLAASNARVIAFGASVGVIHLMKSAFDKMVDSTIEVQKSLADINVALNLGSRNLSQFSTELFKIANNTSTSFEIASKAALEFSRHGLNVEETLKRTSAALALARISGMDYKESVSAITATLNGFTKEALTAEEVINRLTNVGTKYAASAGDIAEGLSRVAATANDANVSFNETVALITSAQQITSRGGAVLANSFKSMFTRLQRPEVLDDLEAVGIAVRDATGKTRPMIDILKSLALTYQTLSSSQKSFVSEAVGGVYQVNTLKAVLSDLGGTTSTVDRVMNTLQNSSDNAQTKLSELNETISGSLIRTMNDLTQAASNVGTSLIGSSLKSGINSIDNIIKQITSLSDVTKAREGSGFEQFFGNLFQGATKGIGNFFSGPGIQFGIATFMKLFGTLEGFIMNSIKDVSGLNDKAKQRTDIEQGVATWLMKQDDILKRILEGQLSVNDAAEQWLNVIKEANAVQTNVGIIGGAMAPGLQKVVSITHPSPFGRGFIPNLYSEESEAKEGGYLAGKITQVELRDGKKTIPAIINSKESITRIRDGQGYPHDFVNPPVGSPAGNKHAAEIQNRYGFNPYKANGFIPNLVTSDVLQRLSKSGISIDLILNKNKLKQKDFDSIPNQFVEAGLQHFSGDMGGLFNYLSSVSKWNSKNELTTDNTELKRFLSGVMVGKPAFPKFKTKADVDPLIKLINGSNNIDTVAEKRINDATVLNPQDVQAVFDRHAPDIITIAAMKSAHNRTPPQDNANFRQSFSIGGVDYSIPTPIYAHKGAAATYDILNKKISELGNLLGVRNPKDIPPSRFGAIYGEWMDSMIRQLVEENGGGQTEENASFDIMGYSPELAKYISRKKPFIAAEIKATEEGATNLLKKYFRTFAGEPGSEKRAFKLSGPVSPVPVLTNIEKFDPLKGPIGILDQEAYRNVSTSTNDFNSLIYSAVATGKALKTHYGPMASGKQLTALELVKNVGGGFVSGRNDLMNYRQFILNKSDIGGRGKGLDTGVFGLALAGSSNIEGFYHNSPHEMTAAVAEKYLKLNKQTAGSQIIGFKTAKPLGQQTSPEDWSVYSDRMAELQKRFGSRFSMHQYAKGFVPNLYNPLTEAFMAENGATNGNAKISRSNQLVSSDNPDGLVAIDKRYQNSAEDAIKQHSAMGQNMSQIKKTRTYGKGFVPNLALFSDNNIGMSIAMGIAGYAGSVSGEKQSFEKLKLSIPILASAQEREAISIKKTIEEFDKLRNSLVTNQQARQSGVDFAPIIGGPKQNFIDPTVMEKAFAPTKVQLEKIYTVYKNEAAENRTNLSHRGFTAARAIDIGGGIISQFAGNYSPTSQAGAEELTTGLSMAAQSLMAFPNKIGKSLAAGFGASAIVSTIDVLGKGLENSRKEFENFQARTQKINLLIDSLSQTLGSFDNHLNDVNISTETLIREQKKITEITSQLSTISEEGSLPGGKEIAAKIAGQSTTEGKLAAMDEYKVALSKKTESDASLLQLNEYISKRGINIPSFGIKGFGGYSSSRPVGYSNDSERLQLTQIMQSNASSAIEDMGDNLKEVLTQSITGRNKNLGLKAIEQGGGLNSPDAQRLRERLSGIEQKDGKQTKDFIIQAIRYNLGNEASMKSPKSQEALDTLQGLVAKNQSLLDSALRGQGNATRRFVNEGQERSANYIDIRAMKERSGYLGGQNILAYRQAGMGLMGMQFGEQTLKTYGTETEIQKIQMERQYKASDIQNKLTGQVVNTLTSSQNFDNEFKQLSDLRKITASRNALVPHVDPYTIERVQGINAGISSVVAEGNLDRFNGNSGQFDPDKFIGAVTGKLSQQGFSNDTINDVKEWLKNNASNSEIFEAIRNSNNELVQLDQESLSEIQKQRITLEAVKAEINFKAMAGFLGGEKSMEDRGYRRQIESTMTKGAFLVEHGHTAEIKGQGAAMLLKSMQDQGQQLNLQNPYIAQLRELVIEGTQETQQKMGARIGNSINRLEGPFSASAEFFDSMANGNGLGSRETATASTDNAFRFDNPNITANSNKGIIKGETSLEQALVSSTKNVLDFGNAIGDTFKKLQESINQVNIISQTKEATENIAKQNFTNVVKKSNERYGFVNPMNTYTQESIKPLQAYLPSASGATSFLGAAGLFMLGNYRASKNYTSSILTANAIQKQIGQPKNNTNFIKKSSGLKLVQSAGQEQTDITQEELDLHNRFVTPPSSMNKTEFEKKDFKVGDNIMVQNSKGEISYRKLGSSQNYENTITQANNASFIPSVLPQDWNQSYNSEPPVTIKTHPHLFNLKGKYDAGEEFNKQTPREQIRSMYSKAKRLNGSKLFSHAGVGGMALGLTGAMMGNETLENVGSALTIASAIPSIYGLGKTAITSGAGKLAMRVALPAYLTAQAIRMVGQHSIDKIDDNIGTGEDASTRAIWNYARKASNKGTDINKIEDYVQGQIQTTQNQLIQAHGNQTTNDKVLGYLGLGVHGGNEGALNQSLASLNQLMQSLEIKKENQSQNESSNQAEKDSLDYFNKMLSTNQEMVDLLGKIAGNGDNSKGGNSAPVFNISVDSGGDVNTILKRIDGFVKDLQSLKAQVSKINGSPQPATIG